MKSLLIVGASSGIGKETARLFQKNGYAVTNVSRTPCPLAGVTNELCDVTVREELDKILQKTVQKGALDCFVYCAGFSISSPLEYVKEGDYRYLFEVNFFSFLHCLQILLPALRSASGVSCVISSLGACLPIPFDPYYTSSKAALNALVDCLQYELEDENVRVVSVMPGGTKTGFTAKRKIYAPAEIDGYAKKLRCACDRLAKTERHGVSPVVVAKSVYNACFSSERALLSSGFMNKCAHMLARLLPSALLSSLLKNLYFTEPSD